MTQEEEEKTSRGGQVEGGEDGEGKEIIRGMESSIYVNKTRTKNKVKVEKRKRGTAKKWGSK